MMEENPIELYRGRLLRDGGVLSDWRGTSGEVRQFVFKICQDAQTAYLTLDEMLRVLRRRLSDFDAVAQQAKSDCDQATPTPGQSIADVVKALVRSYPSPAPWTAPTAIVRHFLEGCAGSAENVELTTEEAVIVLRRRLGELVDVIATVRVVVDETPAGES